MSLPQIKLEMYSILHCTVPTYMMMYISACTLRTIGSGYEAKFGDEVRLVLFNA